MHPIFWDSEIWGLAEPSGIANRQKKLPCPWHMSFIEECPSTLLYCAVTLGLLTTSVTPGQEPDTWGSLVG